MRYFAVKTSDQEFYNEFIRNEEEITLSGINSYDDIIDRGLILFIILGGDRVPWDKGLAGIAVTTSGSLDKGYDVEKPKNYKLKFRFVSRMKRILGKSDFIPYKGTYNSYVGPSTKGERNQALTEITEKQATAILRAVLDYFPEEEKNITSVISPEIMAEVKKDTEVLIPKILKYGQTPEKEAVADEQTEADMNREYLMKGENILLYGVPGSGKSYTVVQEYCDDDRFCERVVFHPDYSYSDFVGQIMPKINEDNKMIEYGFIPGPFTQILNKAVHDISNMYYLIIEEINRGNAPAVFGDVFQLLDRGAGGESQYGVTNTEIANIIYNGNVSKKVRIPANVTIVATMNTSDQNVFTLDTAFKRRWKLRLIPNIIEKADFHNKKIFGTEITWLRFADVINNFIISESSGLTSLEDKRLGAFFVSEDDLDFLYDADGNCHYNPAFAEKVLMYLWDDVFKYNREDVFRSEYNTLEKLIQGFEKVKFEVFKLDFSAMEETDE